MLVGDLLPRHDRRRQQVGDPLQRLFGSACQRGIVRPGVDHDPADKPIRVVHRHTDLMQRPNLRRIDVQADRIDQHDLAGRPRQDVFDDHTRRDIDQVLDRPGSQKRPADGEQPCVQFNDPIVRRHQSDLSWPNRRNRRILPTRVRCVCDVFP